jgi:hypothetical protein
MTSRNLDPHVADLERDGYTIIPDVMSGDEVDATRRAIDETLAGEEEIGSRLGTQSEDLRMVFEAHGKHSHFYGLMLRNPEPLQMARRILGDDLICYNLTIRVPLPTGRKDTTKYGGHLHVDWDKYTVAPFAGGKHYPMGIQSAWCVSDFTEESGATMIWPGSHLSGEAPYADSTTVPPGSKYAEAPAGSVVLWDSALWHTGGINTGDQPRYTLIGYFQRAWIRGINDAPRRVSPEARARMSDEERRLYGLEPVIPPNSHIQAMSPAQLAALTPEEKVVMGFAEY